MPLWRAVETESRTEALKENSALLQLGVAAEQLDQCRLWPFLKASRLRFGRANVSELVEKRMMARHHCAQANTAGDPKGGFDP